MSVAIKTKFLGPTNTQGSRIKASAMDGTSSFRSTRDPQARRSVTVSYDHSKDAQDNHTEAARKLAEMLGWEGEWHIADGGDVYLFVRTGTWSWRFTVEG